MKDKGKANKLYIQKQDDADGDDSQLTGIYGFKIRKICKKGGKEEEMEQSKVKKLIPLGVGPNSGHQIA